VAEIFVSTMSRQCRDQRIASVVDLNTQLESWLSSRSFGKVRWQFTAADPRIKSRRLYPSLS
jgi:hypothetical protein